MSLSWLFFPDQKAISASPVTGPLGFLMIYQCVVVGDNVVNVHSDYNLPETHVVLLKGKCLKMVKSFFFYKCNINVYQTFFFNSFINEGIHMMLTNVSNKDPKGRKIYRHQNVGGKKRFTNRGKTGHRARSVAFICISMNRSHLHCYLFPTIYRAVKSPEDREV